MEMTARVHARDTGGWTRVAAEEAMGKLNSGQTMTLQRVGSVYWWITGGKNEGVLMKGRFVDTNILNCAFVGYSGDSAHYGAMHHGTMGRRLSFPK